MVLFQHSFPSSPAQERLKAQLLQQQMESRRKRILERGIELLSSAAIQDTALVRQEQEYLTAYKFAVKPFAREFISNMGIVDEAEHGDHDRPAHKESLSGRGSSSLTDSRNSQLYYPQRELIDNAEARASYELAGYDTEMREREGRRGNRGRRNSAAEAAGTTTINFYETKRS